MTTNFGFGGFGGFGGNRSSRQERLNRMKAAQAARNARLLEQLMEQQRRQQQVAPVSPQAAPQTGFIRSALNYPLPLGGSIAERWKDAPFTNRIWRALMSPRWGAPAAAATGFTQKAPSPLEAVRKSRVPLFGSPRKTPEAEERAQRARSTTKDILTGKSPFLKGVDVLGSIQEEKPFRERVGGEALLDPLNLLGIGAIKRAMRIPGANEAQRELFRGQRWHGKPDLDVIKLPTLGRIQSDMKDPSMLKRISARLPGIIRADPDDVASQVGYAKGILDESAQAASDTMWQRILAKGDPKELFNLGEDFISQDIQIFSKRKKTKRLVNRHRASINEIVQYPDRISLTTPLNREQRDWIENVNSVFKGMDDYAMELGVRKESIQERALGGYFPNLWEMLGDLPKFEKATKTVGSPHYLKDRMYEEASEAIAAGRNPQDPETALRITLSGMYKELVDTQLVDIIRPYGRTIKERMPPRAIDDRTEARKSRDGIYKLQSLRSDFTATRFGKLTKGRRGYQLAAETHPALTEELVAASTLTGDARKAEFARLKKEIKNERTRVLAKLRESEAEYKRFKNIARKRPKEIQFDKGPLAGRIFTPTELDELAEPHSVVADIRTIPAAQLEELKRLVEPMAKGVWDKVGSVASASRTLQAGTDFGAMNIHGLPILFNKPSVWAASTRHSAEAMADPVVQARFITDHSDTVQKLADYNQWHGGSSEYVEALQTGGLIKRFSQGLQKVEGGAGVREAALPATRPVGKVAETVFDTAEAQFTAWLSSAKIFMWEAMEPVAMAKVAKGELTKDQAYKELADHISKLTGTASTANMGITPSARKVLGSVILFAPRYRLSTYGLLKDVFAGSMQGELARQALGNMMAGGIMFHMAISRLTGESPNLDPTSGKFLTNRVGDANIGFGSAYISTGRAVSGIAKQLFVDPKTKKIDFSPGRALDVRESDSRLNMFIRGQVSPVTGLGWDLIEGKNYIGEDMGNRLSLEWAKNIATQNLLPFWLEGYTDTPQPGWGALPAEFFGMRTFPVSTWERGMDLADHYAAKEGLDRFSDMRGLDRDRFLRNHPDVKVILDESSAIWGDRSRGFRKDQADYRSEKTNFRKQMYEEPLRAGIAQMQRGVITPFQFRKRLRDLGAALSAQYDFIDSKYPEVVQALNDMQRSPESHIEDILWNDYIKEIVLGDFRDAETEDFDYRKFQQAQDNFIKKVGNENWSYIRTRIRENKNPVLQERDEGLERYRAYFEAGYILLEQSGNGELIRKWKEYKGSRAVRREMLEEEFPILKKIASQERKVKKVLRERNSGLDAFLYRWQYTDKVLHPDNSGREEELSFSNNYIADNMGKEI